MTQIESNTLLSIKKKIEELTPTFQSGVRSIFTFGKNQSTYQKLMNKSIYDGLRSDWCAVGKDMQTAINKYKAEISCQRN